MCYLHLWSSQTSPALAAISWIDPPKDLRIPYVIRVVSATWVGDRCSLVVVFSQSMLAIFFCSPKRTVCAPRLVALCGASLLFDQGNLSPRPTQKHQHLLQSINVLEMKGKIHCVLHLYKYILETAFSWATFSTFSHLQCIQVPNQKGLI